MRRRLVSAAAVAGAVALALAVVLPTASSAAAKPLYYVNLGDSYAAGYQYPGEPAALPLKGYANQLTAMLKKQKHPMTLENFGCGGATTTTLLSSNGCPDPTIHGPKYPNKSQLAAAVSFINGHKGQVRLITISIGGNDFDGCPTAADPIKCVQDAMPIMRSNIETITTTLRAAAGWKIPVIAITYPDVILGAWLKNGTARLLAQVSVLLFKNIINPTFVAAYKKANVSFVDVTSATGAYISWSKTTKLKPYGTVPVAVAKVCTLTWFCANGSIHPRTNGYTIIAKLLDARYLKLLKTKPLPSPTPSVSPTASVPPPQ